MAVSTSGLPVCTARSFSSQGLGAGAVELLARHQGLHLGTRVTRLPRNRALGLQLVSQRGEAGFCASFRSEAAAHALHHLAAHLGHALGVHGAVAMVMPARAGGEAAHEEEAPNRPMRLS
jgi:hypothetical protein